MKKPLFDLIHDAEYKHVSTKPLKMHPFNLTRTSIFSGVSESVKLNKFAKKKPNKLCLNIHLKHIAD